MFHQAPIKILLLHSQKGGQMTQSNHPPLPSPPLQPSKVDGLLSYFDKYKSLYSRNQFSLIFFEYNDLYLSKQLSRQSTFGGWTKNVTIYLLLLKISYLLKASWCKKIGQIACVEKHNILHLAF